jgi:hypothetical protein
MNCFKMHGLRKERLKGYWVILATVGANVAIGKHSALVNRLNRRCNKGTFMLRVTLVTDRLNCVFLTQEMTSVELFININLTSPLDK